MAHMRFFKRVEDGRRLHRILAFIRDRASRDGFSVMELDDGPEGSHRIIVGDRFEIAFKRDGEGYVAGGELETSDPKLLKTAYVILRSIRADIEASLKMEELSVIAFAEPEIELVDYGEEAGERGRTIRQTTLDEVV